MAKKVLVAEDDAAIRKLVLRVLEREGFQTETVTNGRDAIACIEKCAYDAVILDLMMPSLSGFDVVARLRRDYPQLLKKVVVITAAVERDTRAIREGEIGAVIRKPFELEELIATVRKCVADPAPCDGLDPDTGPLSQPA